MHGKTHVLQQSLTRVLDGSSDVFKPIQPTAAFSDQLDGILSRATVKA